MAQKHVLPYHIVPAKEPADEYERSLDRIEWWSAVIFLALVILLGAGVGYLICLRWQ